MAATLLTPYQMRYGIDRPTRGINMYRAVARPPPNPPTRDKHILRKARAPRAPADIAYTIESQRVRGRGYVVQHFSGPSRWTCTCPDYVAKSARDAAHRCKHIYVAIIEERGGVPGRASVLRRA